MTTSIRSRSLRFDRMITGSLWRQSAWIVGILLLTWFLSYILLSCSGADWQQFCQKHDVKPWLLPLYLLIDTNALNNLYISEPETIGQLNTVAQDVARSSSETHHSESIHGWMLVVSSITYLIGLLIFNGIIISVLSNWIARRKENYDNGISRYRYSGHYVIMGYDEMVPSVIADIFRRDNDAHILVLSAVSSVIIRERLRKSVKREYFDRIIVNYGHRVAREYYTDIRLELAKEIYVVGKRSIPDHDAINVECVESIFDYLGDHKDSALPKRITCVFEDIDTFAAFKQADIFDKAKELCIDFVPYNFYDGWAKQVFVARRYYSTYGDKRYDYPAVYRDGIGYDDPHYVHLVFVGTSTFAVAFANEAAHLLHFPNGTTYPNKGKHPQIRTRITFIDINADKEMDLFRTRNSHFFEVQSWYYRDLSKDKEKDKDKKNSKKTDPKRNATLFKLPGTDCDFLDVEFEFIKGDVFSSEVQGEINNWATDKNCYLSVFLAMKDQRDNFAFAMNMPESVYNANVPIFIRQDSADTFVTELRNAHTVTPPEDGSIDKKETFYTVSADKQSVKAERRTQRYAHFYPFGMFETAFYSSETDTARAQLFNYLYETADYPAYKFTDKLVLVSMSEEQIKHDALLLWQRLKVSLKWSNLYAVEIFACKQASMKKMKSETNPLTDEQQTECMAHVEHNRWNVEKLLMGYRKARAEEDKYSIDGDDEKTQKDKGNLASNKKFHFAHSDIRPYDDLDDIRKLDIEFTQYIPWITSLVPDNENKKINTSYN